MSKAPSNCGGGLEALQLHPPRVPAATVPVSLSTATTCAPSSGSFVTAMVADGGEMLPVTLLVIVAVAEAVAVPDVA